MPDVETLVTQILGLDADRLNLWQIATRAGVVYLSTLLMVKIGQTRFLGNNSAFDIMLGVILGSVVSRAINGSAEFFPTLGAALALILLHWLFSVLSFRSHRVGTWVKGESLVLARDGKILWDAMRKGNVSERDLMGALRSHANIAELADVAEARLERSGVISVVKKKASPRVLDVQVADGVQTVRIQVD